jgi:hypothetical protein
MISSAYKNSQIYYNAIKELLENKINEWEFRQKYWHQRNKDLDSNKKSGYSDSYTNKIISLCGKEKEFEEKYSDPLYEKAWSHNCLEVLKNYEKGANELGINGERFFIGIWYFMDEYVREYYPSNDEGFDPKLNVDEKTLREKIHAAFDVLERNKDRWTLMAVGD